MTMKIALAILTLTFFCQDAKAQTFDEWFRQKKTQRKYLLQQIIALKAYLGYLKDGYDIAKKGLKTIGDIKGMNFSDHSTYFKSLRNVNASIKTSGKIADIIGYRNQIMVEFESLRNDVTLSPQETEYIGQVYNNLMAECEWSVDLLKQVITDKTLVMKDDERLATIDLAYEDMKDRYTFTRYFINSTRILMMQRSRDQFQIEASKKLNQNP
jgi:hypothetical protein